MKIPTLITIVQILASLHYHVSGRPVATRSKSPTKDADLSNRRKGVIDKNQNTEVKEKTFENVLQNFFGENFDFKKLHKVDDEVFEYIDGKSKRRDEPFVKSNEALYAPLNEGKPKRKEYVKKHKRFDKDTTKTNRNNTGHSESTSSLSAVSEFLSVPKTSSTIISSSYPKSKAHFSQTKSSSLNTLSSLLIPTSLSPLYSSSEKSLESETSSISGRKGIASSSSDPANHYLSESYSSVQSYTPSSTSSLAWYPSISPRAQSTLLYAKLTSINQMSPSSASLGDENDDSIIPSNNKTSQMPNPTSSTSSKPSYTSSSTLSSSTWTSSTSSSAQSASTFKITSSNFHLTSSSSLLLSSSSSITSSSSILKSSSSPSSKSSSSTSSSSNLFKSSYSVSSKSSTASSSSSSSSSVSSSSSSASTPKYISSFTSSSSSTQSLLSEAESSTSSSSSPSSSPQSSSSSSSPQSSSSSLSSMSSP